MLPFVPDPVFYMHGWDIRLGKGGNGVQVGNLRTTSTSADDVVLFHHLLAFGLKRTKCGVRISTSKSGDTGTMGRDGLPSGFYVCCCRIRRSLSISGS